METDQPETFLVAEMVLEKSYLETENGIPCPVAVTSDAMEKRRSGALCIGARVHVETPSREETLIGRPGRGIKAFGGKAGMALKRRFSGRVYLDLTVRTDRNRGRDTRALRRIGYGFEEGKGYVKSMKKI